MDGSNAMIRFHPKPMIGVPPQTVKADSLSGYLLPSVCLACNAPMQGFEMPYQ